MDEESAFNEASVVPPVAAPAPPNGRAKPKQQPQQPKQAKKNAKASIHTDRPPPIPQRDLYHRVNFTYQASAFLAHLAAGGGGGCGGSLGGVTEPSVVDGSGAAITSPGRVEDGSDGKDGCEAGPSGSDHHDMDGITAGTDCMASRQLTRGKGKERAVDAPAGLGDAEETGQSGVQGAMLLGKLSRRGMKENKRMAAHNLLKLDPSLKRAICKKCSTVLIPGLTSRIRTHPNPIHMHKTLQTCLACHTSRSLPIPPIYAPEQPVSQCQESSETRPAGSAIGGDSEIDGPVRKRRMLRAVKGKHGQAPFHLQERVSDVSGSGGDQIVQPFGHIMWAANTRVSGWGVHPLRSAEGGRESPELHLTKKGKRTGLNESADHAGRDPASAAQSRGKEDRFSDNVPHHEADQEPRTSGAGRDMIGANGGEHTTGSAHPKGSLTLCTGGNGIQVRDGRVDELDEEAMWNM